MAALLHLNASSGISLPGKVIGVIGVGNVGSKVVRNASALGLEVLQNDPPRARREERADFLALEALMDADILTCHVPLSRSGPDATWHLFDAARFEQIKPGCIFINAARGGVVDSNAVKAAIAAGRFGSTVLDVWEDEPDVDLELLKMVDIATAHIAGYSLDGKINGTRMIRAGFCRYFNVDAPWDPAPEMTAPAVSAIELSDKNSALEAILHEVVVQCYDIGRDHEAMMAITRYPEAEKARRFVQLRRNYPVRREFHNTKVSLPANLAYAGAILSTWGFEVAQARE